ncbi:hypothetical protein RAS12_27295 [Achromobacter seleniivolatilans]|uniref:Aspartyl/asparaginy/proline hydroxylase domain-containing protein n=1 Tax=Achromobacter seleniivolatilans TaxID=3047478 RepID=A0ABY9LZY8_9BURK|nr:hypothetical protein [Achromobacter sp. R39]WMD20270.1 hypothetical protein RAS12_27295 [Achromobacter sp. R39]
MIQRISTAQPSRMHDRLTSFFWSGDAIRSRSVGNIILTGTVDVPDVPARLIADWQREITTRLCLEPGDVEQMPLARTQARWPEFNRCLQAMQAWTHTLGLPDVLADSDIALMACRGARYHHDGGQYGSAAFCNLFLSEDKGLDVFFPASGHRIPLQRGTAMIFDTCQPHGVIARQKNDFDEGDFASAEDWSQLFLTWELPIEAACVATALGVAFDVEPQTAAQLDQEQVWVNGARATLRPDSGQWEHAG